MTSRKKDLNARVLARARELEHKPSFENIVSLSPVTRVCVRFFRKLDEHIQSTINSHHPELLSVDDDLIRIIDVLRLKRVVGAKICEACGKEISARIINIVGKSLVVCDKCSKLLLTYSPTEEQRT